MNKSITQILISDEARFFYYDYTKVIKDILKLKSDYPPFAKKVLAEGITALGVLGHVLTKFGDLEITIGEEGASKGVHVIVQERNFLSAYLKNPLLSSEYDDKGAALFNTIPLPLALGDRGIVNVSFYWKGQNYQTKTPLAAGDFVTDIVYFFNQSMQIYTALKTLVIFNDKKNLVRAQGFLVQLLPKTKEKAAARIAKLFQELNLKKTSLETIMQIFSAQLLKTIEMHHQCKCSQEKTLIALSNYSYQDLDQLFKKQNKIETICNICHTKRAFKKSEIIDKKIIISSN